MKTQSKPATPPAAAPVSATPPAPAVAPQAKLAPMQVPLTPEQEQELRDALLARLHRRMDGMSACTLQSLAWYADIEDADDGCNTPAEEFITLLVLHHHVRALTPDDAAWRLEEFRENFDSMVEGARKFTARYPEAVKAAAA